MLLADHPNDGIPGAYPLALSGLGYISPQQCAQQGGLWDSFSNQCSSPQAQSPAPYSPFPQSSIQQCTQQGGYWDGFVGRCVGGGQVSPYAAYQPAVLSVDDLLSQGLSSGLIAVSKQSRVVCRSNQSRFCNTTFVDGATGRRKMSYKVAAAYVKRMSAQQQYQPAQYNPFQNNPYQTQPYSPYQTQPYQTQPYQVQPYQVQPIDQSTMNLPFATAGMPSSETEDISWAIDNSGGMEY